MTLTLKEQITQSMKEAMKAKARERLQTIRLIQADIKRVEVDERIELNDEQVVDILDKMLKQRRESIKQYADAGREDLKAQEEFEVTVISEFMPAQLSEDEIAQMIKDEITQQSAQGMQDMGKVVSALKNKMKGRADMSVVSKLVKQALSVSSVQ